MKNLSHIQYVLPISDYSALAEVYCVHEDLEKVEWKGEKFFINKEGKVVAHFEYPSEIIRVELLSNEREDLFAVAYGGTNSYYIVKILDDGTHAADCYGRILVKQSDKVDNPDMIQCVKDSLEFFLTNPELASAAVKSADDAYDLLLGDDVEDAYEKSCCGALDAAYERA